MNLYNTRFVTQFAKVSRIRNMGVANLGGRGIFNSLARAWLAVDSFVQKLNHVLVKVLPVY